MLRLAVGLALLVALACPAAASATLTAAVSGKVATFTGDDAADALVLDESGGLLRHDQASPGFTSRFDFDTATAGDQTLPADGTGEVDVFAGGGPDRVAYATSLLANGDVHGQAGDDAVSVAGGAEVVARGGDGNDTLDGSDRGDLLFGGSGDDTLTGRGAADLLDGGPGDDKVFAREGAPDLVRCGDGSDTAEIDEIDDTVEACEQVRRPGIKGPPPPPNEPPPIVEPDRAALLPAFGTHRLARNGRDLAIPLTCPAAEAGGCRVVLRLETAGALRLGGLRFVVALGTARAGMRRGETRRLTVRLPARLRRVAGRGRTLTLRADLRSTDAAGNVAETSRRLRVDLR